MNLPGPTGVLPLDLASRLGRAMEAYEFDTFVLGFKRPEVYDREAHEARYRELKIAVGEELSRRFSAARVDFLAPELRVDLDEDLNARLTAAPLLLAGRYRKLSREIPSSRWVHHRCRGHGCPTCRHSGSLCGPSVQELLARPVLEASGGTETYFHAAGREDTDALMLGRGRPFVLEVRSPRRRRFPLREIQEEVRESLVAEVLGLRRVSHGAVRAVKTAAADKTYRAWIEAASALPSDAARRSERLAGTTLEQLSPVRVMHRRGRGCLRRRKVVDSSWLGEIGGVLVWEVRVEAGTYVKELVSGDGGRTRPSLSEVLGVACRCAALDVIAVNWDPPWESAVEGETGREGAGA